MTVIDEFRLTRPPVAKTEMLIRRPVGEVFEAFVDPAITSKFWFSRGSRRLEPGVVVRWDWEMFGVSDEITVKTLEQDKRIVIEWSGRHGPTTVEWRFDARPDGTTFVTITNDGFGGSADEVVDEALDSTGGFTIVLAGLKAYLEHGIRLNLVPDKYPDGVGA